MSLTDKGWRKGAADFLAGLQDADALATALKNGTLSIADFVKLATVQAGLGIPNVCRSPVIDFTATSSGNVIVPAVAGKFWNHLIGTLVITAASGTCTGAPQGLFSAATGIASGTIGALMSTAQATNAIAAGPPTHGNTGLFGSGGVAGTRSIPTNSAGTVDVTTGATGASLVLRGYYVFIGTYE